MLISKNQIDIKDSTRSVLSRSLEVSLLSPNANFFIFVLGANAYYPFLKNFSTSSRYCAKSEIPLKKVLVFSKFARYDFERHTLSKYNDQDFETILRDRGTDYDKLVEHKTLNKKLELKILQVLRSMNIEAKIANRYQQTPYWLAFC